MYFISTSSDPEMEILDITVLRDVTPYSLADRYQRFSNSTIF